MKVGLHRYATDTSIPQKDGVNLAHENITQLMERSGDARFDVAFHDLTQLLRAGPEAARKVLQPLDCVISNVGPHAHYYHWLREKCGLSFRIVRDVRTAIWTSYLLQEHLVAPLLRPMDTLLVASNYTHGIYRRLFAHVADASVVKCYPLTISFPARFRRQVKTDRSPVTIGYVGRLSEDKNFPQAVDLLVSLNQRSPRRYVLVACGDVHSASCAPDAIAQRIRAELGAGDYFRYEHARSNDQIWPLLAEFDLMVFPSTSNLETLGRVLVEASHAGVPVVGGCHAAAAELVPAENLCPVTYRSGVVFSTHFDHCLGQVSLAQLEPRILAGDLPVSTCHETYAGHTQLFLDVLAANDPRSLRALANVPQLLPPQERFIANLSCSLPRQPAKAEALDAIGLMARWFVDLQHEDATRRRGAADELLHISRYPERTQRFIDKHFRTRGDLTNVGGMDIELSHVIGFYPEFTLGAP